MAAVRRNNSDDFLAFGELIQRKGYKFSFVCISFILTLDGGEVVVRRSQNQEGNRDLMNLIMIFVHRLLLLTFVFMLASS